MIQPDGPPRHSARGPSVTLVAWFGFAAGIVLVLGTFRSVIASLVVPRGLRSTFYAAISETVIGFFRLLAARRRTYEERDRVLSFAGPALLLCMIATWVLLLFAGYALMFWPFTGPSFGEALRVAGSSMFTLGFAVPSGPAPTALIFVAAATGLVLVALEIAYLPTLYGAFNRRETLVTMLESRSGVPAWGPEILARHELIDNVASLASLYGAWESWAADLAESHTTYPSLIWFRSPHPLRSWITALLSVLDAAALHLALNPLTAPAQARPFMRMGYMALREISRSMEIPVNDDPKPEDPVELTRGDFDQALQHLTAAGWEPERSADDGWMHFRGWRVTYEALAYRIADRVDAPPALWSGPRRHLAAVSMAPVRPPHRAPKGENATVRAITAARRSARSSGGDHDVAEAHEATQRALDPEGTAASDD